MFLFWGKILANFNLTNVILIYAKDFLEKNGPNSLDFYDKL
jgi:hypothetical protein